MSDTIRNLARNGVWRTTHLPNGEESAFQNWYSGIAGSTGLSPQPDDPEHHYDWRAAFRAGATPEPADDGSYHWPSQFKKQTHPNRFINGVDTLTGRASR